MNKLSLLKPVVQLKAETLIKECRKVGITLIVTSTLRTHAEQDALYAQGRTTAGKVVTNATAGFSYHNWGVAFDVVGLKNGVPDWNGDWLTIGKIGESLGLEWGGRWKFIDKPHFSYTLGYTLEQFQKGLVLDSIFDTPETTRLKAMIVYLKKMLDSILKGRSGV